MVVTPFGEENMWAVQSLPYFEKVMMDIVSRGISSPVTECARMTHFNADVPENQNVRYKNARAGTALVFTGDRWIMKDLAEVKRSFILTACELLSDFIYSHHRADIPQFIRRMWRLVPLVSMDEAHRCKYEETGMDSVLLDEEFQAKIYRMFSRDTDMMMRNGVGSFVV